MSAQRRKYKAEALAWKRAALECYGALSQVHFGLTSYAHVTDTERIKTAVLIIIKECQDRFETEHPPDNETGWDRMHV